MAQILDIFEYETKAPFHNREDAIDGVLEKMARFHDVGDMRRAVECFAGAYQKIIL